MRGSVRNDADFPLSEPVILARGQAYALDGMFEPGDVATFELTLPGEGAPAPTFRGAPIDVANLSFRSTFNVNTARQSAIDIIGPEAFTANNFIGPLSDDPAEQEARRRQFFVTSLVEDAYESTGRGDNIYLAGWANQSPLVETTLEGANWNAQDTALYLIELEVEHERPVEEVVIVPERFTWMVREYQGLGAISPVQLSMQQGEEVIFRYTPLPDAVLRQVDELVLNISGQNTVGRTFPLQLWNWAEETWEQSRRRATATASRTRSASSGRRTRFKFACWPTTSAASCAPTGWRCRSAARSKVERDAQFRARRAHRVYIQVNDQVF
ncbi:MAG: hypothetical protein HC828_15385 [Blastochloris sp.]|nr:hypothetical protein [Blastochloris sp.]